MPAYYNEYEPYAAEWLRNLIKKGLIPDGEVDTRSIVDVAPDDIRAFTQCHFFAGIGGWGHALRLAEWPDDRPIWTGSCPCQPFSVAGKGAAQADERHLWPVFFGLIRACRPPVVMGEQVAAAVGKSWLDGVSTDLEGIGYATGAAVIPACAVDAPHRRDRLWFVADANSTERGPLNSPRGRVAEEHALLPGQEDPGRSFAGGERDVADANEPRPQGWRVHAERGDQRSAWSDGVEWAIGADGKARRVGAGVRLLAHGVPGRVGRLRAYGNAIVPQVAAEVIMAFLEATKAT